MTHASGGDGRILPSIRASDAERELVAQALHAALTRGQLELDELEERLAGVYRARTRADLSPFTADLGVDPLAERVVKPAAGEARGRGVAVMSSVDLQGQWTIAETYEAVAFWGEVKLDLREAVFAAPEVTIRASVVMAGMTVIVGEDTEVVVDGVGVMGAFDGPISPSAVPATRRVRVTGFAVMGGVEVRRRPRTSRLL